MNEEEPTLQEQIADFFGQISDIVWGPALLIPLLLATGLYLTVVLKVVQFRKFGRAFYLAFFRRKDVDAEGDISHYQALSTALAATVGVGNIAGVATALWWGGPGAVFWMWFTGLVGMATKYSEAFLGVYYRRTDAKGEQSGGPMFYLREGLRSHEEAARQQTAPTGLFGIALRAVRLRLSWVLGGAFAILGAIAAFGIGNGVQANTVADSLNEQWGINVVITALVLTGVGAIVILGGIRWIGRVTAGLVPFMVVIYILGALWVLIAHVDQIPNAIEMIFTSAFTGTEAIAGGFLGAGIAAVIRYGVARGIFSNESGLGTGGIAAAAAKTTHPVRQAMVSMTQTFIDTLVVVSFTALTIIVTGAWNTNDENLRGARMTMRAFNEGLPGNWGANIVTVGILLFAFSTLLGWAYYGERCMDYLFGRSAILPYRIVFVCVIFIGAVASLDAVWNFADIMNGLMAIPNLIGLLLLSPLIIRETKKYFQAVPKERLYTIDALAGMTPFWKAGGGVATATVNGEKSATEPDAGDDGETGGSDSDGSGGPGASTS